MGELYYSIVLFVRVIRNKTNHYTMAFLTTTVMCVILHVVFSVTTTTN